MILKLKSDMNIAVQYSLMVKFIHWKQDKICYELHEKVLEGRVPKPEGTPESSRLTWARGGGRGAGAPQWSVSFWNTAKGDPCLELQRTIDGWFRVGKAGGGSSEHLLVYREASGALLWTVILSALSPQLILRLVLQASRRSATFTLFIISLVDVGGL